MDWLYCVQVELLASSPVFWLCLIMIPIITLTVDVILKAVRITVFTSETDRIRDQGAVLLNCEDNVVIFYSFS